MKSLLSFLVFILFLIHVNANLYAQNQTDQTAHITFYRMANYAASTRSALIDVNDSTDIKLFNHSYYTLSLQAGTIRLRMKGNKKNKLIFEVKAGQSYHVLYQVSQGFFTLTEELLLLDSVSAASIIKTKGMDKLYLPHTILIRPQHRIGIGVSFGGGFESMDWFTLTDGRTASFSFGTLGGFEIIYGQELSKNLDFSLRYGSMTASLTPTVKDVTMTATIRSLSMTPAWIIPIRDGDYNRLKLGAGVDYYFPVKYQFDFTKVPSIAIYKDNWTYRESVGFHASFTWESNMSKHISFNYGLRYNFAQFDFQSGIGSIKPNDAKLSHPNGSGISFQFGLNYHF